MVWHKTHSCTDYHYRPFALAASTCVYLCNTQQAFLFGTAALKTPWHGLLPFYLPSCLPSLLCCIVPLLWPHPAHCTTASAPRHFWTGCRLGCCWFVVMPVHFGHSPLAAISSPATLPAHLHPPSMPVLPPPPSCHLLLPNPLSCLVWTGMGMGQRLPPLPCSPYFSSTCLGNTF